MTSLRPAELVFVIQDLRTGGAERHAVTLLRGLAARGHAVSVVCVEAGGPLVEGLAGDGVTVVELDLGEGWKWRPTASRDAVRDALDRLGAPVVMTSGYSAEVLTRLALASRPAVALLSWKHNIGHLGRIGVRDRLTEALLGRRVTRYLAVSYTQLAYLRDYLRLDPARTVVVRNAVSLPEPPPAELRAGVRAELALAPDDVAVGCVAVLRAEKDHATVLEALRAVPGPVVLVVVGDGPLRADLEARARDAGLAARVRFLGTRADVPRVLAGLDAVVLASRTIENLPYSVLEAMAAGLPVVATAVGALPELVDDGVTGWLVPPASPDALAAALRELVADDVGRRARGAAARQRVASGFTLDRQVTMIEHELREVVPVDADGSDGPTTDDTAQGVTTPAAPRKSPTARKAPAKKAPARTAAAKASRGTTARKAVATATMTAVLTAGSVTSELLRSTGRPATTPADTTPVAATPPAQVTAPTAGPVTEPAGAPRPRGGARRVVVRMVVVVLLAVLGAVVGLVAAGGAAPVYTATAQVLVRERDYAAIVLGPASVRSAGTPQRVVAAQVLAAQSMSFADEVARRADLDPAVVTAALTVTASPDADVVVFSVSASNPAVATTVADTAATYEVTSYRDQLITGLGSMSAGGALGAAQTAQLAQVQAFERISPSAQVISSAGKPTGGPVSASRGLATGAAAGAVVAFLLLALQQAMGSRRRNRPSGDDSTEGDGTARRGPAA